MAPKRRWIFLAAIALAGCDNTVIDLTPGTVVLPPLPCGDGTTDLDEQCDDGNRLNGDGCTTSCMLGPGDPAGPADPEAQPYAAEPDALRLPAADHPVPPMEPNLSFPIVAASSTLAASWCREEPDETHPPTISTRLLATDGTLASPDAVISLSTGWTTKAVTTALLGDGLLLAWSAGSEGLWRAGVGLDGGLTVAPSRLVASSVANGPALASVSDGYLLAWYESSDSRTCEHTSADASRIFLQRLDANGDPAGASPAVPLEDADGARNPPRLVGSTADSSVGLLWWRASHEPGGECTVRFGVADDTLTTVLDGGAIGPGMDGSIATAEGSYQVAWRTAAADGNAVIGVASFDPGAVLAGAPVMHEMPFTATYGNLALAAGDHGLLITIAGHNATERPRLYFFRTDLLGRAVEDPFVLREVDPTCNWANGCEPGPANVVWAGDAFVVVYFVTLDPLEPTRTTEMRMVRLVPET